MIYRFTVALLQPFPLLYLLTLAALARLWLKRRGKRRRLLLAIVPLGMLGLVSLPVVGHLAVGSLEWRYPPHDEVPGDAGRWWCSAAMFGRRATRCRTPS